MVIGKGWSKQNGILLEDGSLYLSLVRGVKYCILTSPDILFSVNKLCQFMLCPMDVHWVVMKRLMHYLKSTIHYGLTFLK